jgi:hypothetical protein
MTSVRIRAGALFTPILRSALRDLHPLYIPLHRGTDGLPAAFFASSVLYPATIGAVPYPLCNIASHHSDPTARVPVPDSCAVSLPIQSDNSPDASSPSRSGSIVSESQQVEQGNIMIARPSFPSNSTTTSEIGEASRTLLELIPPPCPTFPRPKKSLPPLSKWMLPSDQ